MPIGIENIFFNYWMVSILILYILAMLPVVRRSFIENHSYKWNNVMLISFFIIIVILLAVPFQDNFLVPYPWNFFFVVFAGAWKVVVLIINFFNNKRENKKIEGPEPPDYKEYKRKTFHILAGCYLIGFGFAFLLNLLVYSIESPFILTNEFFQSVYFLTFIQDQHIIGISLLIFAFVGTFVVQLDAELLALNWPEVNFPFKKTIQDTNREVEENTFGAHLHMISGFAFSAILIYIFSPTPLIATYAVFATICISIFGDMFAALIGRRFGKHKWRFFNEKSIEGTVVGGIAGFVMGFIFIGWLGGLIGCIVIIATDIFLPKISKLSDNILNPLILSILFVFLMQFENLIQPIVSIGQIAKNVIEVPELNYKIAEGFWGTFPCVILLMGSTTIISLIIALKYKANQIKRLFTGSTEILD